MVIDWVSSGRTGKQGVLDVATAKCCKMLLKKRNLFSCKTFANNSMGSSDLTAVEVSLFRGRKSLEFHV